ncbi:hypothetical protein ERO13_D01G134900v2 [Gossypium hirsutum]|uniref:Clathrin assembly protein At1g25240 n=1 Tax=Gossypium hirsutum TaxID=3635 RepID=A0A1U8KZG7_GOSHI|nr:putative clathrin assembly protein At1g25240 [Gossypium hirsutum]KAG4162783.1 hypothetical protein ERO13_D01G134900v2 [Gossypium hirsutum]
MAIWKRATGAIKDKNSLVLAKFITRGAFGDHDLEAAIIKATSHDEHDIDKRNTRMLFSWIRASPNTLCPLVRALSRRMEKTRSWVVAIKGLMLVHGLIHCKVPDARKMGRLPFDFSSFSDRHSRLSKTWGFNIFIRQYFVFLDERAVVWLLDENKTAEDVPLIVRQLLKLRKRQCLLDMLLKIRPRADNMKVPLILEAMDCVIIEIFDVYSRICSEIAKVLMQVHSVGKLEAAMALEILRKATSQGAQLSQYFEFCKEYGVLKANEFHKVTEIPEEDVQELERIINGVSDKTYKNDDFKENDQMATVVREENNAIVEHSELIKGGLKTTITDKWEVFHDNINLNGEHIDSFFNESNGSADQEATVSDLPLIPIDHMAVHYPFEIPDLISF